MKYTIKHITILSKIGLYNELKNNTTINSEKVWNILKSIKTVCPLYETDDDEIANVFSTSENVRCEIIDNELIEEDEVFGTFENDINNLENKLGLTTAEKWYNTLSDNQKLHVKELSVFFNPNLIAFG